MWDFVKQNRFVSALTFVFLVTLTFAVCRLFLSIQEYGQYRDRLVSASNSELPKILSERRLNIEQRLAENRVALHFDDLTFACSITEVSGELVDCSRILAKQ